jgi:hypothetical protein
MSDTWADAEIASASTERLFEIARDGIDNFAGGGSREMAALDRLEKQFAAMTSTLTDLVSDRVFSTEGIKRVRAEARHLLA